MPTSVGRRSPSEKRVFDEDLIPREEVVITVSHTGYIKRLPVTTYRSQKRGGRGVVGMDTKDEDFVEHLFVSNSHNYLMFFTDKGKVYRIKAYEIPELGRTARGTPIINLLQIEQGEKISAVIQIEETDSDKYLFFATREGIVKRRRSRITTISVRADSSQSICVKKMS